MPLEPETLSALVTTAIHAADSARPRAQQTRAGLLGMSDLGWCRQKALLVLKQTPPSDPKSMWSAIIGTALGELVERALKDMFPTWLTGTTDNVEVTYTMKNGASLSGHPDVVIPDENAVVDVKTKNGVAIERRKGASLSNRMQRHGYAKGLIAAGILDGSKPVYVGNIYLDRAGKEKEPLVLLEPMDPGLDDEITSWVDDVIYARIHNEDAPRDISPSMCAAMCEFFTVCRGGMLPAGEVEVLTDEDSIRALDSFMEGKAQAAAGMALLDAAKDQLRGLNGIANGLQVRTTHVNEIDRPGYYRVGYDKVEVFPYKVPTTRGEQA